MSVGHRGSHVHVHADKLQKKRLKYPVPTQHQTLARMLGTWWYRSQHKIHEFQNVVEIWEVNSGRKSKKVPW